MTGANTILALLLTVPFSGHPSLTTGLTSPPRLTVGDRFDLELVVTCPTRSLVTGPLSDSLGIFMVADEKRSTAARAGYDQLTYHLSVAGFKPGTHHIPTFVFLIRSGAKTDTLRSDTASVTIASVLPEKMKDVNGLKPAESFPNPWLWIVPGLALLLALAAYVGRRLYLRFRRLQELAQA